EMGNGQVDVRAQGLELSSQTIERLTTDLMVNDQLSSAVLAQETTQVILSGPEIERLKNELSQQSLRMAERIQSLILSKSQSKDLVEEPHESHARDERSIFLNENVTVFPHEFYPELLVIGGDVEVQGTVGALVVMGGDVRV